MQRFSIDDTAVILIDHQVGTNTWASTTPLALLQRNVIILAKFAKGTGMPLVLTSSQETNVNVQGPLMPELEAIAPEAFAARIAQLEQRIQALTPRAVALAREQQEQIQELAVAELLRQKQRLAAYATQARFAVAQLYDRATLATHEAGDAKQP